MAFSRFQMGIWLRSGALAVTLAALMWLILHTGWYATIMIVAAAAIAQTALLARFATHSTREVARFLDAIAFDDPTASFSALPSDKNFAGLAAAMTRVIDMLRAGRAERAEQAQYLQALVLHVPVALISVSEQGAVKLLNIAARRLFENGCTDASDFSAYGDAFATGMDHLYPGDSIIVRMECRDSAFHLKAAAAGITLGGIRHRLICLQNIETELTAHELAAWQMVIRVMAHEVMNSLTPISSLAATAQSLVADMLNRLPPQDSHRLALSDANEALETMARRSEGLLHFVQNHRRLTKRMVAEPGIVPVQRVFSRLQRLLAGELAQRGIALSASVEPLTLEIAADAELLDQALINLVRNAIEALQDTAEGRIALRAYRDRDAHAVIAVSDNGPGIAPGQMEKVFVPFFTTKKQGSGIGLTLTRQIATVHGAAIDISQTPGGGTTVSLRF
jgi:nitrogen fixation/metabolism regulation signal transduction histidine kinase